MIEISLVSVVFGLFLLELIVEHYSIDARTDWEVEKDASFWNQQARSEIENKLKKKMNIRTAKNVILFLGDGMGINTVTAGRIRKGQVNNQLGEDFLTEMEQLDETGFSKTSVISVILTLSFRPFYCSDITSTIKRLIQLRQPQHFFVVLKHSLVRLVLMEEHPEVIVSARLMQM